ncbi:MAG: hypothetical protein J5I91_03290 [Bacteroidetes bacterium]|nr:hypothetical protein [Bacteroidota bacterium]
MIRKVLAIFLAFFVVGSVPGFTLFIHYCNGTASQISLWEEADDCNTTQEDICCKKDIEKSCCIPSKQSKQYDVCDISHSDCCQTQIVKTNNLKLLSFRPDTKLQKVSMEFDIKLNLLHLPEVFKDISVYRFDLASKSPLKISGKNICISDCLFLI